jgi:predicted dehydrogenase
MKSESLRFGFIGSGFIANFQAKAMEQVRGCEISAVLDRTGADALCGYAAENGLGFPKKYKTVTEIAQNCDVVAIYSPNASRIETLEEIVAAKRAGAPVRAVICDKPLGRTVKEARRMVELAKEGGLLTAYFENQIFMKAIQTQLKQLAPQQKTMGPLMLARSSEEHGGPHMPWFWDPTTQGGGVLSDMGCHSIAVSWYVLNPLGKGLTFLQPETVSCEIALLKWGQPYWRDKLMKDRGVDYKKTPAEDFATGMITFRNPETEQRVKAQFTDSWMFEKQGLRLFMDGMGPGYAFEVNTLASPLNIFIGDAAAERVADGESALEKATATRGLLAVQSNEADLYGYVDENKDAVQSFMRGHDALLPFSYGLEITRLVMASYMSAELGKTINLKDPKVQQDLENFVPLVQQGRGAEILYK